MSILHSREFEMSFGLNKQADIETPISTAKINKMLAYRGFAPPTMENPNIVSDRDWHGKGHSHPTFWDQIDERMIIPPREFSMTQLSALFAPAFVLGNLVTTQPDSAGAPTVYDHAFTFQDLSTNKEALYTTMSEKMGSEYQNLLEGVCINSFTLTGNREDHVVLSWEGMARQRTADATAMPSLATGQVFFKILKATFSFGPTSSPLAISTETLNFNLTVSQNLNPFFLPGGTAGEEHLLSKVLIGDQTVSGQLRAFIDNTRRNYFLNGTECELTITLISDTISGAYKHQMTIVIPHFKIASESFDQEGTTVAYTMALDEQSVLKGTEAFITVTVRSDIDGTDLLVQNP